MAAAAASFEAAARAVKNGLDVPFRRALAAGGPPAAADSDGRTLLHWAAHYHRIGMARHLLGGSAGQSATAALCALGGKDNEAPLHTAVRTGAVDMVALLAVGTQRITWSWAAGVPVFAVCLVA